MDPAWQARSDWEIYKGFAKKFSELAPGHLGVEKEVVLTPLMHDTPANWPSLSACRTGSAAVRADSRQDRAADHGGRARLPNVYKRFTALGPLMNKAGNGGKGIAWNTGRGRATRPAQWPGRRDRRRPGHAAHRHRHRRLRVILQLGARDQRPCRREGLGGAVRATGREHAHLALHREDEKIRFRDVQAQPRKIISRPPGAGWRARRSRTTPATPTCTS